MVESTLTLGAREDEEVIATIHVVILIRYLS